MPKDIKKESQTGQLVKDSLFEYGMYTIEDRAIPDVRDGLKPAQRRVMFAMHRLKRGSKAMPVKCARIVGDTIGQFHPHGDAACYDTLVNLTRLRSPIVDGTTSSFGNQNTLIETKYAHQRYTETKMTEFGDRLFDDIEVIPTQPTFDEEDEEPIILPIRVPLLLVNGSSGTALGMKTSIPPHNMKEVIDATLHLIKNPDCTTSDLMKFIKGPDYGSGALLSRKKEIQELYETGKGRLAYTCAYRYEEGKRGVQRLIITGLSPGFRKNRFIQTTKALADQKLLVDAANDDGTIEEPTRIVVEFKDPNIINDRVLPLLKSSITYQMYALGKGKRPRMYSLKEMLEAFVTMRRVIETRVLKADLEATTRKLLVAKAKLAAVTKLDVLQKVQREAKTDNEAVEMLVASPMKVNEEQATVILDTPFRSLLRLNQKRLKDKAQEHKSRIEALRADLGNIDGVVARRLKAMEKYAPARGTRLRGDVKEVEGDSATTVYYVGVTPETKVDSFVELPTKSKAAWNYVNMVATRKGFAMVSEDNQGQSLKLSYLDKLDSKTGGAIVGVVPLEDEAVVAVSENGNYVAFPPEQRRTQFPIFKTLDEDDKIVAAVGYNDGDTVYVWFDDGSIEELDEPKISRPNVASKKIKKGSKTVRKVLRVLHVPADLVTVTDTGEEYAPQEFEADEPAYVLGQDNLLICADGKRLEKTFEQAGHLMSKGEQIEASIPLRVPDAEG